LVEVCYVKIARILLNQVDNGFRNSMIQNEGDINIDHEVRELIHWIKICEEDGDFALLSENLKKQASMETLPRN
jgi:hypothetical protein